MKATGIVRRIDDLGRVVIPKEIRRTMRIREGDPLEIYTDNDGEVIFKKYSPIGELSPFASQYADVLAKSLGEAVIITDRDHVIAAAGISRKEVLERRVSHQLEEVMENRRVYCRSEADMKKLYPVEGVERYAAVAAPIIVSGDIAGSVILLTDSEKNYPGDSETRLVTVAANFLGKQMEE